MGPLSQLANAGTGTGEMASDEDKGLSEGYDEGRLIEQALAVARRVRDVPPSFEPGALPESDPTARSVDSDHPETAADDIGPDERPDLQLTGDPGVDSIRRRPLGAIGLEEDASDPVDLSGFELTIEDFGSAWSETVRGWVVDAHGNTVWRPIVTTTDEVPNWTIESTLGVVRGESAIGLDLSSIRRLLTEPGGRAALERRIHLDRSAAEQAMVEEAVARGAHAVVGVTSGHTPIGTILMITCTGTAVTLAPPARA